MARRLHYSSSINSNSDMFESFCLNVKAFLARLMKRCEQKLTAMKTYTKILFSILMAAICTVAFAADKPDCKKTGKNCPMNDNKECNCGKSCNCANM